MFLSKIFANFPKIFFFLLIVVWRLYVSSSVNIYCRNCLLSKLVLKVDCCKKTKSSYAPSRPVEAVNQSSVCFKFVIKILIWFIRTQPSDISAREETQTPLPSLFLFHFRRAFGRGREVAWFCNRFTINHLFAPWFGRILAIAEGGGGEVCVLLRQESYYLARWRKWSWY